MGGDIGKETTSNGNLRSWSIVTKIDTIDPKGWPHPEGIQRRRNTEEASHTNQVQRRGTQGEGAGPTREKEGQPPGPTHAEPQASAWGRGPRTKVNSQTHQKEGKQRHDRRLRKNTVPTWDRWPHREDQEHRRTKESRGAAAPRGQADKYLTRTRVTTSTAKLRRVDNQGSTLPPQAISKHWKLEERTQVKIPRKHQEPGQPNGRKHPAKTRTREGEFPQKKAGPQPTNPSPNKRPRKKTQARKHKERVRPEAKATERRNRDPRIAQHAGAAGGATDLWPNHPNPIAETWKGGLTTKGSPDCKLRSNWRRDTPGQKRTYPKVRESKQGHYTVAQRADTTPTGAPWHRVQNLANPCKPAGAGEAQKYKGRVAAQPTPPEQQ